MNVRHLKGNIMSALHNNENEEDVEFEQADISNFNNN